MAHTVVGLFSSNAQAEQVKQNLIREGFEASDIHVLADDASGVANDTDQTTGGYAVDSDEQERTAGKGIGHKISSFFSTLTGGDEDVHHHYATGVNQGGALLTVRADDQDDAYEAAALLRQYGAREIEDQDAGAAKSGFAEASYTGAAATGETAIPVVEEQLEVGKRQVDRGGVRVYSHIVETPVEADVTLREERVNLERRPVNRLATAADFEAARGGVIELTATGEEAVIGKSARVVEEVLVGKESSTHTEAIHDSVRKTEVEVEELAGVSTGNTSTGAGFDRNRS